MTKHQLLKSTTLQINLKSYLSFTSNRCHIADFFGAQCVNNRALSNVGVTNKTNTDLLFVCMKLIKNEKGHSQKMKNRRLIKNKHRLCFTVSRLGIINLG